MVSALDASHHKEAPWLRAVLMMWREDLGPFWSALEWANGASACYMEVGIAVACEEKHIQQVCMLGLWK
jgi:hypothetical protein